MKQSGKRKEHFFEIRRALPGEVCKECFFPILTHSCWYAGAVMGPFCRDICIAKANELGGKMRAIRPDLLERQGAR